MSIYEVAKSEPSLDWEDLLLCVQERRVIPIVGRELLISDTDAEGRKLLLDHRLAVRLAALLDLRDGSLPPDADLNEVAMVYLQQGGQRRRIYSKLKGLLDAESPAVPEPLRKLAAIDDFRLFLSTTFNSLLATALDEIRFGGAPRTERAAFSPHLQIQDLPCEAQQLEAPLVYQLFGTATAASDYAVTDEDVLEFLHTLQSETRRPQLLFDKLRTHHLLFIGCGFPDWLARFFVRTVSNQRLLNPRETSEILADSRLREDPPLARFLRLYNAETFAEGPVDFVDELHERWTRSRSLASQPVRPVPSHAPAEAIFLSYASEDLACAERLQRAFEVAGLDIWFNRSHLESGDAWDLRIKANIRRCCLFIPLLSRSAQRRREGYFRKEWRWAIERAEGVDDDVPFIVPVIRDEITPGAPGIPEYFWTRQFHRLKEDEPEAELVQRVREIVRELRVREAG